MKIPILNIEIRKASKQEVSNIAAWSSGGRSLLLSRDKPMLLSTVYRCVDLISDSVAVLPLKTYQLDEEGFKKECKWHPAYHVLNTEPNEDMTRYVFFKTLMASVLLTGNGYAYIDDGALVVDVKEESDTKEIPPCMILKSDGASLYNTTDLATIIERMKLYHPDEILYVVDKRQELHFIQCFRCAKKAKLVEDDTRLTFLGFGTMNGKDGKPFKTRDGGVMRLENLIKEINEEMYRKIMENHETDPEEARKTAQIVGLSAIKYGDLSNQASKDYVFDVDRFTSFEGNTGPYILYTIVRIKSILARYQAEGGSLEGITIQTPNSESEKALMLALSKFNAVMENAFEELAPHKICAYIYELANDFNHFYHEVKILSEENEEKKKGYLALLMLTRDVLESCIHVLGFTSPERM